MQYHFPTTDTDLNIDQYVKYLRTKRKMRKLGSGVFASVYGSKSGRTVVKVGALDHNWGNACYLRYLKVIQKYQDNPYFPNVKSIKVFRHRSRRVVRYYMAVELERLVALKAKEYCLANLIETVSGSKSIVNAVGMMFGNKTISRHLNEVYRVLNQLSIRYDLDIHEGNIMRRKNGQVVITDPVA